MRGLDKNPHPCVPRGEYDCLMALVSFAPSLITLYPLLEGVCVELLVWVVSSGWDAFFFCFFFLWQRIFSSRENVWEYALCIVV